MDKINSLLREGLIPAWAGKTRPPAAARSSDPGSSPRGRGKQRGGGLDERCTRLIPAWAGKTRRMGTPAAASWAHPRVGGENSV